MNKPRSTSSSRTGPAPGSPRGHARQPRPAIGRDARSRRRCLWRLQDLRLSDSDSDSRAMFAPSARARCTPRGGGAGQRRLDDSAPARRRQRRRRASELAPLGRRDARGSGASPGRQRQRVDDDRRRGKLQPAQADEQPRGLAPRQLGRAASPTMKRVVAGVAQQRDAARESTGTDRRAPAASWPGRTSERYFSSTRSSTCTHSRAASGISSSRSACPVGAVSTTMTS